MAYDDSVRCPHCGGEIKKNARACPHCGSDEETGWSGETYLDGIDLSGDDEYEAIKEKEFGEKRNPPPGRLWVYITGAVILAVFLFGICLSFVGG